MTAPSREGASPTEAAAATTREILGSIHQGDPALIIDSPPGAGKTTTAIRIAATAWGLLKENVMIACWTNRQAIDLAKRLAKEYCKIPVQLFIKVDLLEIVAQAGPLPANLSLVSKTSDLSPKGVAVSNASKWVAYPIEHHYEWLILDEAYQLPDYRFHLLVPLANRYVLIGDPGQIAPLIQSDLSPWGCHPAGPHLPCPIALSARHPDVEVKRLPVSWRLPDESAKVVRDAFYEFDFDSGDPKRLRRLELGKGNGTRSDQVLNHVVEGQRCLVGALLPAADIAADLDPEVAAFAAETALRILARRGTTTDELKERNRLLEPGDIGVVTAHRVQVAAIEKELISRKIPTGPSGVVVETTERWQGLERRVMIVHHPLAGLDRFSSFELDRGRLCVMLSRHRIVCIVIGRESIQDALEMHTHTGDRFAGKPDEEHLGWSAHHKVWQALTSADALVPVKGAR